LQLRQRTAVCVTMCHATDCNTCGAACCGAELGRSAVSDLVPADSLDLQR
jgi:hypothetical protein